MLVTMSNSQICGQTPSDATDSTIVQLLGAGGPEGRGSTEGANKYQMKKLGSF